MSSGRRDEKLRRAGAEEKRPLRAASFFILARWFAGESDHVVGPLLNHCMLVTPEKSEILAMGFLGGAVFRPGETPVGFPGLDHSPFRQPSRKEPPAIF